MRFVSAVLATSLLCGVLLLSGCIAPRSTGGSEGSGSGSGESGKSYSLPNSGGGDSQQAPSSAAPSTPSAKPDTTDTRPAWARLDFRHSEIDMSSCVSENPDGVSYAIIYTTFTYFEKDGDIWYSGIVEVRNTGSQDMTFEYIDTHLEDGQGKVLADSGTMIAELVPCQLAPGETGWIYLNSLISEYNYKAEKVRDLDIDAGLIWVFDTLKARAAKPTVRYDGADIYLEEGDKGLRFIGTLTHTGETYPVVEDWVVLFDARDTVLAVEKVAASNGGGSFQIENGETLKIYDERFGSYTWVHNKEITDDMVAKILVVTKHHVGGWYY